jgi:hypothetical protein
MNDGERRQGTSSSAPKNVNTSDPSSEVEVPSNQEERRRVFVRVEQIMESFRSGQNSRFQTLTSVVDELDKWSDVSDGERERAFISYLAEIRADSAVANGNQHELGSTTQPSRSSVPPIVPQKRLHDEVEDLVERLSRGGNEEEEDESTSGKRRIKEEDMPWYRPATQSVRRDSCSRTCRTLQRFSDDLSGVKALLRVAFNLPEGIPTSQWDRILRGESVDLNQILSSMHYVQLDEERKGRVGDAEVVFAPAESKRHVRTGAEWSAAFRRLSKGVTFLFPHREDELREYAEYVEGLFAAKQTRAHAKVILYDQSIRNQVGGGQNILLTDYHKFHSLGEAILHADGVEYGKKGGTDKPGGGSTKPGGKKGETCKRFNSQKGCHFSEEDCYYKHVCLLCGKGGHGKPSCRSESQ